MGSPFKTLSGRVERVSWPANRWRCWQGDTAGEGLEALHAAPQDLALCTPSIWLFEGCVLE